MICPSCGARLKQMGSMTQRPCCGFIIYDKPVRQDPIQALTQLAGGREPAVTVTLNPRILHALKAAAEELQNLEFSSSLPLVLEAIKVLTKLE